MKREKYSLYLDRELLAGIKRLKQRTGIPESEQIRRALRTWLEKQGVIKKRTRKEG